MDAIRASRFIQSGGRRINVSFEFFPPKTEEMEQTLWEAIARLAPLAPSFVSVTYGAGGSTRERTHATVKRILGETALTPAAHLTCVAATRAEIDEVIRSYCAAGVRHSAHCPRCLTARRASRAAHRPYRDPARGVKGRCQKQL